MKTLIKLFSENVKIRIFSEAAFFVGSLFIIYIWLGFLIISLWSFANK